MKLNILRKKYPKFTYKKYDYKIVGNNLKISFLFEIPPDIRFQPCLTLNVEHACSTFNVKHVLDNLIFHIGLMEMLSYWKTACSPEIVIEAGFLDKEQIKWWKNLIIKGMGQFFYENKIDWRNENFLTIITNCQQKHAVAHFNFHDNYLVPFAGGRDSIITLEGLKKQKKNIALFTVNPVGKIQKTVKISGIKKQIIAERFIDKKLLELNKAGYLNGHTPFTALLSFLSILCAVLFGYKNIAFSNEKSADEGNVKYLGKMINHQWAKSSEFEKMFKGYCRKYLVKNLNYFSFTRKYGDLEISKMLAKYPKYFPVFSSCNKKGGERWCGKCPKCLFVYLSLYPYLDQKQMLEIFGKDLFGDRELLPIMKGLMGQGDHKPFECVGTYRESRRAFRLSLEKAKKSGKIPYLLSKLHVR